ncbi:MAG: dihydroneopterin aldolase [Kiritimatiellae bacterium]|nr:dihydroneopterin aldolase [Kiritimatiellia bacterium]
MDQIKLNGIEVECIIGDLPEERENEQKILVDVSLDIDLEDAVASDRLDDTVDYALLVGNIREALEEAQCRLLERAAGVVADVCLSDPRVESATVGVRKFGSVPGLGSAEVRITRT